jgi:Ca2+-binding EF-hand superfamily protein
MTATARQMAMFTNTGNNTDNPQSPHAIAERVGTELQQTADSDLFTRLETAQQGSLLKADGKMGRSDLRAALNKGGLSPQETAIAEYLLANFDNITSGRHIRPSDLRAHSAGIALSASPNLPHAGLHSFIDDRDASSFFGFVRHDKDFRDLANGTSISRDELERGLNDPDFTAEQKQAIQFMLENFTALSGDDGRIQENELKTFMRTVAFSQVSHSMDDHRTPIQDFALDDTLYKALSGSSSGRGTITQAELEYALAQDTYTDGQKAAITFLLAHFDILTGGKDTLKRGDLQAAAFNDIAMLSKRLADADEAYLAAANARSDAFNDPAYLASFVSKVDGLFKGDDQGHQIGFLNINTGAPGDERFDHRSTFGNPISLFSNREAPTDGHISRNDLQMALSADILSTDEQNFALMLLQNFSSIGGGLTTITAEKIGAFLGSFNPTVGVQASNTVRTLENTQPTPFTMI